VGDRYQLSGRERTILFRGVCPERKNISRQRKISDPKALQNSSLHIDGLNQMWTIATYLSGGFVFLTSDGLLRDTSEIHGKSVKLNLIDKSAHLLINCLKNIQNCSFEFYIDDQVDMSNEVNLKIKAWAEKCGITIKLNISKVVDYKLHHITSGFIASSDSEIIDNSSIPIIDLARYCLEKEYNPYFFDIGSFNNKK